MKILFDQASHEYRVAGIVKPHVTGILAPLYRFEGIPDAVLERARDRGSRVHKACEDFDLERLDIDSVEPDVLPRLLAWKRFLGRTGAEVLEIEKRIYVKNYDYCGTLDRVVRIGNKNAVVEIKATAKISPIAALQTAAYAHESGTDRRFTVQLHSDGTPRVAEWKCRTDFQVFLAALSLYNWRVKNGNGIDEP